MRRRINHLIAPKQLAGLAAALFVIWLVVQIFQSLNGTVFVIILAAAGGVIVVATRVMRQRRRDNFFGKINFVIEQHLDQLVRRKAQLVHADPYGKEELKRWKKEIDYFITHHVYPALTIKEQPLLNRDLASVARMISERTEIRMRDTPVFGAFSDDLTPTEFEVFCAEQLKQFGWNARVTLRSRDQGVDVIGEKAGVRIVLQCKLYTGPVGNQAVQEIVAGKAHERAHFGAVVTNSRYTSPAEQLASTNGILLLHYSDLANLDALLQTKSRTNPPVNSAVTSVPPTSQVWPCPVCRAPAVRTNEEFCGNCGSKMVWPK